MRIEVVVRYVSVETDLSLWMNEQDAHLTSYAGGRRIDVPLKCVRCVRRRFLYSETSQAADDRCKSASKANEFRRLQNSTETVSTRNRGKQSVVG